MCSRVDCIHVKFTCMKAFSVSVDSKRRGWFDDVAAWIRFTNPNGIVVTREALEKAQSLPDPYKQDSGYVGATFRLDFWQTVSNQCSGVPSDDSSHNAGSQKHLKNSLIIS